MRKIAKMENGAVVFPPRNDGNRINVDRNAAWLAANGFSEIEIPEPESAAADVPRRYSRLAIIRALGDGWSAWRAKLEAAGLLDEFFAADYLAADDPKFAEVFAGLTEDEKNTLETCGWKE